LKQLNLTEQATPEALTQFSDFHQQLLDETSKLKLKLKEAKSLQKEEKQKLATQQKTSQHLQTSVSLLCHFAQDLLKLDSQATFGEEEELDPVLQPLLTQLRKSA
jgi:hypothetical protein